MPLRLRIVFVAVFSIGVLIVIGVHGLFGVFDLVENTLRDVRLASRGQVAPPDDVLIVDFPGWRSDMRGEVAQVVRVLGEGEAKTIALDILLDEPWDEEGDAALEAAIRDTPGVILAMHIGFERDAVREISPPLERFKRYAWGVGFANLISDPYDKVVRESLAFKQGSAVFYSLPLLAYAHYNGSNSPSELFPAFGAVNTPAGKVRTSRQGTRFINYYGGKDVYDPETGESKVFTDELVRNMSALGLVSKDGSPFEGKIVIVGSSSVHTRDIHKTPFDAAQASETPTRTAGIIIQANIMGNLLDPRSFIPDYRGSTGLTTIILTPLLCMLFIRVSQRAGFAIALPAAIAAVAVQYYSFPAAAISLLAPATAVPLTYFAGLYYKYAEERRSKDMLRAIFGHYLSKNLAQTLLDDPTLIEMGGKEIECTFLICDIDSFSTISENLKPVQVVELLNFFFGEMHEAVKHYEGWLNKYLGDGMLVVYGALLRDGKHARRAALSALEIRYRLSRMHEFLIERFGIQKLGVTIGIHSGNACVGNIGAPDRMEYTVIGDAVNVCERIVGEAKKLGADIVITQEAASLAGNAAEYEEAGVFGVKGRNRPVTIYKVK